MNQGKQDQMNEETPESYSESEAAAMSGVEALARAVEEMLRQNAKEFALVLKNAALKGQFQSFKLIYELTKRLPTPASAQEERKYPSLAEQWANEPEWVDEDE